MKTSVATECEQCGKYFRVPVVAADSMISCPFCRAEWQIADAQFLSKACPICGCKGFFVQKDFNQVLGCSVMLVGVILVPFTYGLSLPVFALIDWLLYKRIGSMAVCYRCRAEFRGFEIPAEIEPFEHFKGMKYEPKQLHIKKKESLN